MSMKQARGTKRTCQNDECGSRFYDLNHNPIVCPVCGSIYALASSPIAAAVQEEKPVRRVKKPEFEAAGAVDPEVAPEVEGEEALAEIEGEETIATETDETFLEEEEEEGGDVSNIIGGPVAEGEEEV